ncbi:hypothetical protein Q3G72_023243 [Acer saccharum]|nr:hypothetical protein Q3G72_023243 [Acer saccharum]
MDSNSGSADITHNFPPFFKVHKDGRIERYAVFQHAPAGLDPTTGIESKDVVVSPDTGVKARIFLPKINGPDQKLPLIVHYHGGGFCLGSALDLPFKFFLTSLAAQANAVAITIDYRLAPEHHLPAAHNDSWAGLQWVASHANGQGPESWLNEHVDFGRVYLVGESAGANIASYVAIKAGVTGLAGLNIIGTLLVHPYFGVKEPDRMYEFMCPTSTGFDNDPIINPAVDPNLKMLKSDKVLVCVAEKDSLRNRGGESVGANIAHFLAVRAGTSIGFAGLKIEGLVMVHPFFGATKELDKIIEMYKFMYPSSTGRDDDPKLNPEVDVNLKSMVGDRVLVCAAEKDLIRDRGLAYYDVLLKSEWNGNVEFYETLGEGHCFHLFNPNSENDGPLNDIIVNFIYQD